MAFALRDREAPALIHPDAARQEGKTSMNWTTPEICEVAVGMEVTSYLSASN